MSIARPRSLCAAIFALALAGCGNSQPGLDQTGANPDLPEQRQTLVPPIRIATPEGWGGESPTAPQGFTVTALATDLKIPRQTLVLPNGDILVQKGQAAARRPCAPRM